MNTKNKGQAKHLANIQNNMQDKVKQIVINIPPETSFQKPKSKKTPPPAPLAILDQLLSNHIQPIDFRLLAYPELEQIRKKVKKLDPESKEAKELRKQEEKLKLVKKHWLVYSIEHLLQLAKQHNWGLCRNQDFIYLFNGAYWVELQENTFVDFLGQAAQKMGVPEVDAKVFYHKKDLYSQFLTSANLPSPEVDPETVLINLQNGTFEITPKKQFLRKFNPSDFLTYQLPFDYNPEAQAPLFRAYLEKVLPDKERQRVLAEYLGYIFLRHGGRLKLEQVLVLYGTGGNGKSVLFEIVKALLGRENVSNFSLEELTNKDGYYRAKIGNKLLNYASEINSKLQIDTFKKLVSGEPVAARLPYGQPMELTQYAKLIFNTNELPRDIEHTEAFFRRWLIIPFDVTIPKEEQDKELHAKIIEKELSGVFNWILEGLERLLMQKKFSPCQASEKVLQQYRTNSDSVKLFLSESEYFPSAESLDFTPLQDVFNEYKIFCLEGGYRNPCNRNTFKDRMQKAGYNYQRKSIGNGFWIAKN